MPRLVLHAGDCKAGSTAVQSVLQLGSWRYTGDTPPKLKYAQGGRRDGLNHHRLSDSLHLQRASSYRDQAWGRLGEEFAKASEDIVVISSERFEFAPPEAVRAALEQFVPGAMDALQVVIYVRPHAARLRSGYAQNIRQGLFSGDLAAFLEESEKERRFHYADRLVAWKETFGDALTVRPMIRDTLTGGCVVQDFLTLCAGKSGAVPLVEKIPSENRSLNPHGLAFMDELHKSLRKRNPAPDQTRAAILQRLCTQLEALPAFGEGQIVLPPDLLPKLEQAFAEDAARCDAEIFGRPVLVPALQAALEQDATPPAPPTPEEIARLRDLSIIWLDMMGNMRQQMAKAAQGGKPPGGGQGRPGGR